MRKRETMFWGGLALLLAIGAKILFYIDQGNVVTTPYLVIGWILTVLCVLLAVGITVIKIVRFYNDHIDGR